MIEDEIRSAKCISDAVFYIISIQGFVEKIWIFQVKLKKNYMKWKHYKYVNVMDVEFCCRFHIYIHISQIYSVFNNVKLYTSLDTWV